MVGADPEGLQSALKLRLEESVASMKQVARSSTPRSALPRTPAIGSAGLRQCRHVQTCRHHFAVLDPRLPGWRRAASLGRMAQWLTAIVQAPTAAPAPSSLPVLSPQASPFRASS